MPTRTPRATEPEQEPSENIDAALIANFQHLARVLSELSGKIESMEHTLTPLAVHFSFSAAENNPERPKVMHRRSLDAMQFALHRLESGEPRPADDDSPQVLTDAINEVIHLRQIINDMMQASSNVYQGGLVAIRNMTAQ